jgi:hypothetical protein
MLQYNLERKPPTMLQLNWEVLHSHLDKRKVLHLPFLLELNPLLEPQPLLDSLSIRLEGHRCHKCHRCLLDQVSLLALEATQLANLPSPKDV